MPYSVNYSFTILLFTLLIHFSGYGQGLFPVTNLNDAGTGSLREAITLAGPGDLVRINVSGTINLQSPINISKELYIQGPMPAHIKIDGSSSGHIFVNNTATTGGGFTYIDGILFKNASSSAIQNLAGTVYLGRCVFETNGDFFGGAIQNLDDVVVENCSFIQNVSDHGGAIYTEGLATILNCTFSGNTSGVDGGAIVAESGSVELTHNTFISNNCNQLGGAVHNQNATVTYTSNLFFGNGFSAASTDPTISMVSGANTSSGGNFIDSDASTLSGALTTVASDVLGSSLNPNLNPITTDGYGLAYFTFASSASPAIDIGSNATLMERDQRRGFRVMHGNSNYAADAGSIEFTPYCVTSLAGTPTGTGLAAMGTLGWALDSANLSPNGPYSICFDLSGPSTTINVNGTYSVFEDCIIDGYTQPGSLVPGPADQFPGTSVVAASPSIELNGSAVAGSGIVVKGAVECELRGLSIYNYAGPGILYTDSVHFSIIEGMHIGMDKSGLSVGTGNHFGVLLETGSNNNVIGDWFHHSRNVIANNDSVGVRFKGSGTSNNGLYNSFIGVDALGMSAAPNGTGVLVADSANNTQIGDSLVYGNLISGNIKAGVALADTLSDANMIHGNLIGTNVLGTAAIGNHKGIVIVKRSNLNGIGGPGKGNLISGNDSCGIQLDTWANGVFSNFIGVDISGLAPLPNGGDGVLLADPVGINLIGFPLPEHGNIISGNTGNGIKMIGANLSGIAQNIIGLGADSSIVIANKHNGILLDSACVFVGIGGDSIVNYNIISGNDSCGIKLQNTAGGHVIAGNHIGTVFDGNSFINRGNGSHGIRIEENSFWGSRIGDSTVAGSFNFIGFNGGDGISIVNDDGNRMYRNMTWGNAGLGIDLGDDGPTANDPMDTDVGENLLMNYPVISSATACANGLMIDGAINTEPNKWFKIEFYVSSALDPTGMGEGEFYIGDYLDSTDAAGNFTFSTFMPVPVPGGWFVTATSIRQTGVNMTSEYSDGVAIDPAMIPPATSPDVLGCAGDTSIEITGFPQSGGNIIWGANPDFTAILDTVPAIFADSAIGIHVYYVAEIVGPGPCLTAYDSVIVTIEPHENPYFSMPDFCSNLSGVPDSVTTPGGTFSFDTGPIDGAIIDPVSGNLSLVTGGTTYQIQYTTAGVCRDSSSILVTALDAPVIDSIAIVNESCRGMNDGSLEIFITGGTTPLFYSNDGGASAQLSNVFSGLQTSVYNVVIADANGCLAIQIPTVGLDEINNLTTSGPHTTCPAFPVQIGVTGTGTSYLWSGGTVEDSLSTNPVVNPQVTTTYTVIMTSSAGCNYADSVLVIVDSTNACGGGVSINAFSPDGDGVNDTWVVPLLSNFPNNTVTIYNRWGDQINEYPNYDNATTVWNGTDKGGNELPAGTYFYGIHLKGPDQFLTGWVQITK